MNPYLDVISDMLCENCHQKDATVRFTQVVNQQKQVLHLCRQCAEKPMGLSGGVTITVKGLEVQVSSRPVDDLACERCGMTFLEFQNDGLFGCPECYEAFGPRLARLMKRIHGADRHIAGESTGESAGDVAPDEEPMAPLESPVPPTDASTGETIEQLEILLCEAVGREAFEEAADLRDRIASLKTGSGGVL